MIKIKIIITILFIVFIAFLAWRSFNKVDAFVVYDSLDNNILVEQNGDFYNIDYDDLYYYNNRVLPFTERIENYIEEAFIPVEIIMVEPLDIEINNTLLRDLNGGSQNVHDTFVQESIKKAQKNIQYGSENYINEIQETFKDDGINNVLKKIQRRDAYISNVDKTETSIIRDVWSFVKNDENLKEEFKNQLLDCVDKDGNLVCGTGVVTRITSSLFINDPEKMPKTKEMINREILDKFSKLYTGAEDKQIIKQQILNDYTEESMKKKVNDLIDEWIEHV